MNKSESDDSSSAEEKDEENKDEKEATDEETESSTGGGFFRRQADPFHTYSSFSASEMESNHAVLAASMPPIEKLDISAAKHYNERKNITEQRRQQKRLRNRTKSNGESLIVLYIQMRLCDFTLRYWMNNRNQEFYAHHSDITFELDDVLCMNIFRQIVSGVEYIHSKSIIHRDLKVQEETKKTCFLVYWPIIHY